MPTTNQKEGREQDCQSISLPYLKIIRSKELELDAAQRFKFLFGNDAHYSQEPRDRMKAVLELILAACQVVPYGEETEEHQRMVLSNQYFQDLICRLDKDEINAQKFDSYQDIRDFLISIKDSHKKPAYSEAVTWRIDCFLSSFDEVLATENNS